MPETPPPAAPELEGPEAEPASRRLSAVWLVPLLALIVALGVAWRTYSDRGPLIEITFENAAGVEAGTTTLRFRDVVVGVVEAIDFTPDLKEVVVTARLDKDVAHFADADAEFWVVRPSVTAQGVTGIETVISGVYIETFWDSEVGEPQDRFQGLQRPPLTPADAPGLRVRLRAANGGSMTIGAPILFKQIQVGKIEDITLTEAGDVMIDAFVNAPNHERLTEATRFWNSSGFSIELGTGGASLNVASLVSLLQGGVSFDNVGSDATRVATGHIFELYPSETAARENLLENEPGQRLTLNVVFDGSVRGLRPGAAVEFRGITVGEVRALQAAALLDTPEGQDVTLRATLSIVPRRLGIEAGPDDEMVAAALDLLADRVEHGGLRARLATSGLLSQTLYVDLAEIPDAPPAELDRDAEPYPLLPSAPSDISGIAASAEGALKRISGLPLEEVVETAVNLLANLNSLVTDERIRSAPENLGLLMSDLRTLIGESGIKEAPADLRALLASVQELIDQAVQARIVEEVAAVLEGAKTAVESVDVAADEVPALVEEIEATSRRIRALPLPQLIRSGTRLAGNVNTLVTGQQTTTVPASINASLAELRGLLADLRAGGAIDNLNATLVSVRQVSDEIAAANLAASLASVIAEAKATSANVSTASQDLPELLDSLTALSDRVNAMPLDELVASANDVVRTADTLLAGPGVAEVPPNLAAALDELRGLLGELREGGAVNNLNATLASADRAAGAVENAANDLPALLANLNAVAARADTALASVSPGSDLNRDTVLLLQEVRDAARSINSLVLALERRPNSVLFGR